MTHIVVKITPRGRVDLYCGPSATEATRIIRDTVVKTGERIGYAMGRI